MQYLNAYTPPQASPEPPKNVHLHTPPSSYDLNFSGGPIPSLPLQTDKVALIPLIPSLHGPQLFSEFAGATKRGEVKEGWLRWMPYARDIERSLDDLLYVIETQQRAVPGTLIFAIFDLTKSSDPTLQVPGPCHASLPPHHPPLSSMAGIIGLLNCDRSHLTAELGHVIILPKAQRTHVLSHAAALIQHYTLDYPYIQTYSSAHRKFIDNPVSASTDTTDRQKALGMRRLQWQAHHLNSPSIASAQRLGFKADGIIRMQRIAPGGGERGRDGDWEGEGDGTSRSSWMGSIVWEEWERETRGLVDGLVAR